MVLRHLGECDRAHPARAGPSCPALRPRGRLLRPADPPDPEHAVKRVDGVITLNLPVADAELELLNRLGLPVVAIGSPVPGRPLVQIDDRAAVRMATEHLIGLGHRRIGYIGAVPLNVAHVQTPWARLDSYETTMADHDLAVRPDWVVASDWTADASAADIVPVLRSADRPTAIVAASDEIAIGVIQAARRLGVRVPEDLSVVGIDDYTLSAVMDLTTVRQDVTLQGQTAARLLLTCSTTTPSASTGP